MTYRIRTVSEMTGIPRNTLIAWERRYGFVKPGRHGNSYRSYSDEDIAKLVRVKNATSNGLAISEAIAQAENAGLEPKAVAESQLPAASSLGEVGSASLDLLRSRLLAALLSYDARKTERLLTELVAIPFEVRVHQVFFPILRELGELWERGRATVAQEHFASAIIRDQLVTVLVGMGRGRASERHAVCTTFPGDLHEMGALAMAVMLHLDGYRVSYLGTNLPAEDLAEFCQKQHPKLVCVSAILQLERPGVLNYAQYLLSRTPSGVRIVVGGRGIDLDPPLELDGVEFIAKWPNFSV